MAEALNELRRRLDADPQDRSAALALARALSKAGALAEADRLLFERGLSEEPAARQIEDRLFKEQRPLIEALRGERLGLASRSRGGSPSLERGSSFDSWRLLTIKPFLAEGAPLRAILCRGALGSRSSERPFALLARIESLLTYAHITPGATPSPEDLAGLRGLRAVGLGEAELLTPRVDALASLPELRVLEARSCRLEAPSPGSAFPKLQRLTSSFRYAGPPWGSSPGAPEGPSTIAPFFDRPEALPALRHLRFAYEALTRSLCESLSRLPVLEALSLRSCVVERGLVAALETRETLQSLELEYCGVLEGASRDWPGLPSLERLSLTGSTLGQRPGETGRPSHTQLREALAPIGELRGLRELDLSSITLTAAALPRLSALSSLRALKLASTKVNSPILEALAPLTSLENLSFSGSRFGALNKTLSSVLPELPSLSVLDLSRTKITPRGLNDLGRLPALRCLDLRGTGISEDAVRAVLPELDVILTGDIAPKMSP